MKLLTTILTLLPALCLADPIALARPPVHTTLYETGCQTRGRYLYVCSPSALTNGDDYAAAYDREDPANEHEVIPACIQGDDIEVLNRDALEKEKDNGFTHPWVHLCCDLDTEVCVTLILLTFLYFELEIGGGMMLTLCVAGPDHLRPPGQSAQWQELQPRMGLKGVFPRQTKVWCD